MKMSNFVHNYPRFLVLDIEKPLFTHEGADCVRVNEKYIKQASQNSQYLVIRTPNGEKQMMPKAVKKVGKRVKEVFLYEDRPMIMYELLISHSERSDMDKWRFS